MSSIQNGENSKSSNSESTSNSESESSYDAEQDESYILLSNEELISDESESDGQEDSYFSASTSEEENESDVAWTDSDDEEDLREELENEAKWLHTEELPRKITKTTKKLSFKYSKHIFTAKCKIKLFNVFKDIKVLVDSFNLIYLIKNFDDYKTYKIDFFKITDMCQFNNMLLFSSNTSSFIKQVNIDGKVTDIKKGTGNIKKMLSDNFLYVLGDKLYAFNANLSLEYEFGHSFVDICAFIDNIVCLSSEGDIYIFDKNLNFKNKLSLQFKFQFKSLYSTEKNLIVCTDDGLILYDSNFQEIKSFSNLKEPISSLVSNKSFIIHGSLYNNSLRILKPDLTYYEKFPYSKIKINPISALAIDGETVFFSDSRFISSLKLSYI